MQNACVLPLPSGIMELYSTDYSIPSTRLVERIIAILASAICKGGGGWMDGLWMDSGRPSRVRTGRGYATAVERITGQILSPLVGRPSTWYLGSRRTLRRGCTPFLTGIACMNPSSSTPYRVAVHQQLPLSPETEANPPSISHPQFTA